MKWNNFHHVREMNILSISTWSLFCDNLKRNSCKKDYVTCPKFSVSVLFNHRRGCHDLSLSWDFTHCAVTFTLSPRNPCWGYSCMLEPVLQAFRCWGVGGLHFFTWDLLGLKSGETSWRVGDPFVSTDKKRWGDRRLWKKWQRKKMSKAWSKSMSWSCRIFCVKSAKKVLDLGHFFSTELFCVQC